MRERHHPEGHLWERTSVVDEAAIDHERIFACIPVSNDEIEIRVAQRVDLDLTADPVTVFVSPPRLTLGRTFELNDIQVEQVIAGLQQALPAMRRIAQGNRLVVVPDPVQEDRGPASHRSAE